VNKETEVNRYHSKFGGAESKESGADGKFFAGLLVEGINLFKRPPRFEVYGQLGHLPSQYHAFLCGNLHRGIDGWKVAIEYADKMRDVQYPVELIYPQDWNGPIPNPFQSYDEYEDVFLKPILKDVEALRELLRKHKIGKLSDDEVEESAKRILAEPANKPGNPTGSNQYQKKEELCNLHNSTQSDRAKENGVSRRTQIKLDALAKDRPDLLDRVCAGELSVNRAAIEAGIVKRPTPLDELKRAWTRASEVERGEFLSWISNEEV